MIERSQEQGVANVVAPTIDDTADLYENKLRPLKLKDFIGQKELKATLATAIMAAQKRGDALDHTLFHGPPGLGKTTLANIVAGEMGVAIKTTSGPALEKQGDLAAIITNLKDNDVLFIDEIHRLRPPVEEILYSAMEDYAIDIILGKGPAARSMRLPLPKFTLIGATTKLSSLSSPLRDRFGNLFKLAHYSDEEIKAIIERASGIFGCDIDEKAAEKLAACARCTPRIANRLLKRVRDYVEVHHHVATIEFGAVEKALEELGVDSLGLDNMDRLIIGTLIEKFQGGPVGLNTLSAAVAEEESTIEDVYEPYLIRLGLLERTQRGRIITEKAYNHLGIAKGAE